MGIFTISSPHPHPKHLKTKPTMTCILSVIDKKTHITGVCVSMNICGVECENHAILLYLTEGILLLLA
jgi:hypothetical protein